MPTGPRSRNGQSSPRSGRLALAVLSASLALLAASLGCARPQPPPTPAERRAIADSLRKLIVAAYDPAKGGDAVTRLMSLYPDTGRVISASAGRVTATRPELERGIRAFWTYVGQNMRDPRWEWGPSHVDVLSRDAAVVTLTYRVPHTTPRGAPHTIGGAWTAVFVRRAGKWTIVQEHLSDLP
jgi:hypothetical protein